MNWRPIIAWLILFLIGLSVVCIGGTLLTLLVYLLMAAF